MDKYDFKLICKCGNEMKYMDEQESELSDCIFVTSDIYEDVCFRCDCGNEIEIR